jgi:serine/threonine protein kinase
LKPWPKYKDVWMRSIRRGDQFGSWTFVAELGAMEASVRWLVLDERHQTNHLVYVNPPMPGSADQRRFIERVSLLARSSHPHLPKIEAYSFTPDNRPFVVTPYTGTHEGIMSVRDHITRKGGRLTVPETERAINHLISAIRYAHTTLPDSLIHGAFDAASLLIDRNGSLIIENYALRSIVPASGWQHLRLDRSDEVRSIVRVAYEMLTGQPPAVPMIPASKLCSKLGRRMEQWLATGLDPAFGYDTIEECAAAFHTMDPVAPNKSERPERIAGRPSTWVTSQANTLGRLWNRRPAIRVEPRSSNMEQDD